MFRKIAMLIAIAMLAFTAACSSTSSAVNSVAGNATGAAASAGTSTTCPTSNTEHFAKTRFVANAALAGGAFHRYIYKPAKEGKFKKGAHGRIFALVKAAAAGAFVINRLDAAVNNAKANPTLCKLIIAPVEKFKAAIGGLIGKAKGGEINPSDVTQPSSLLENLRGAATSGGAGFTDNQNASIG